MAQIEQRGVAGAGGTAVVLQRHESVWSRRRACVAPGPAEGRRGAPRPDSPGRGRAGPGCGVPAGREACGRPRRRLRRGFCRGRDPCQKDQPPRSPEGAGLAQGKQVQVDYPLRTTRGSTVAPGKVRRSRGRWFVMPCSLRRGDPAVPRAQPR
jgi:hypothetical protein